MKYKFRENSSRIALEHIVTILIAVFSCAYKGKTTQFSMFSSCHRTTVAHFLNHGTMNEQIGKVAQIVIYILRHAKVKTQDILLRRGNFCAILQFCSFIAWKMGQSGTWPYHSGGCHQQNLPGSASYRKADFLFRWRYRLVKDKALVTGFASDRGRAFCSLSYKWANQSNCTRNGQ